MSSNIICDDAFQQIFYIVNVLLIFINQRHIPNNVIFLSREIQEPSHRFHPATFGIINQISKLRAQCAFKNIKVEAPCE